LAAAVRALRGGVAVKVMASVRAGLPVVDAAALAILAAAATGQQLRAATDHVRREPSDLLARQMARAARGRRQPPVNGLVTTQPLS